MTAQIMEAAQSSGQNNGGDDLRVGEALCNLLPEADNNGSPGQAEGQQRKKNLGLLFF